jgi:butyryl-CoA dehydrogenase
VEQAVLRLLTGTARSFAERHVKALVAAEGRDGDLNRLPEVLDQAEAIGLVATSDPESPGHDDGVWGAACVEEGATASLAMLEEVARVCAGVACCVHSAGLGALELIGSDVRPRRVVTALFEDGWRLAPADREPPEGGFTRIEFVADRVVVSGTKSFVAAVPGCDGWIVYGVGRNGWQPVVVHPDAAGLQRRVVGTRMGLAAVELLELDLTNVPVAAVDVLAPRPPWVLVRRLLLGLAAIAVGNARGALTSARSYAEERFQGGGQIESHPAIQALLGDAASRVAAAAALLRKTADEDRDDDAALWRAVAAKLRCTVDCCQAVTDCLQAFGGYGYMEEYGLEKRLRDAVTLKATTGRPDDLRRTLAAADHGAGW